MPRSLDKAKFEAAFGRQRAESGVTEGGEQDPAVQELWALLEPRLEEKAQFEHEVRAYLNEATKDITAWRTARALALGFAIAVVVLTVVSLGIVLFHSRSNLTLAALPSDSVRVALLAGAFTVIFGLTAIIMRGAFAPIRKEEASIMLPEHAKLLGDAVSGLMGKG